MDFLYTITFLTTEGDSLTREGRGLFYPHNVGFNLEDMLWSMAEEHGRPQSINVSMEFFIAEELPLLITKE